ncbi:LysR family transcriptional regulator [Paraburkholderia oxyphila]|uniref:LysR family transcriptional regulator n=1 Tax=Paraburkholderia oxyphila TaxID=614212 RepID=UPI0004896407|nr:LysR family transcriptional regulator [Paraburkholderia oxyphila]
MELRHLRYFVAVAEEGSLTVAAERRLYTSQPSLSRQIRDLEYEVGAQLFVRSARGIELTDAGKAFLDHARLALAQVDAACEAARRAARPSKPTFAVGFLSGQEVTWLAEASRVLANDLQTLEMTVSSEHSPDLAEGLSTGRLDVAFMRAEANRPDLEYVTVARERFVVLMPSDHRLAAFDEIDVHELASELFIGGSDVAGPMRRAIENYLNANDLAIEPAHRVHNLTMAMSLIASTRGVALLPAYAEKLLPWSVTSRPLKGEAPTIELVVGYNRNNRSPILATFLSRIDQIRQ